MKPITEDVVHSLLQGVAAREKKPRLVQRAGSASAKVVKFTGPTVRSGKISIDSKGTRRTISGVFCYVSRLGKA